MRDSSGQTLADRSLTREPVQRQPDQRAPDQPDQRQPDERRQVVFNLAGELDLAALPALQRQLTQLVDTDPPVGVVVDVSRVTFMDCAALGTLLAARNRLGGDLVLRGANPTLLRLLEFTGLRGLADGAPQPQDVPPSAELVAIFARMSGFLLSEETVHSALTLVTALATETISGAFGAGVTLMRAEGHFTAAASDQVVESADTLQYQLDEGPCLSALRFGDAFRVEDTRTESRWPRWCAAVAPLGMRSALTTPLLAGGEVTGAIKVYAREPGAFDQRDQRLLALFAAQAAILLANMQSHEKARQLTADLESSVRRRDVISMAKGILMVTRQLTERAAFAVLAQTAERSGQTVQEIAEQIVDFRRIEGG